MLHFLRFMQYRTEMRAIGFSATIRYVRISHAHTNQWQSETPKSLPSLGASAHNRTTPPANHFAEWRIEAVGVTLIPTRLISVTTAAPWRPRQILQTQWSTTTVSSLASENKKMKRNSQRKDPDADNGGRDGAHSGGSETSCATVPHGRLDVGSSCGSAYDVGSLHGEGDITIAPVMWRQVEEKQATLGAAASNHHSQSQGERPRNLEVSSK